jgi:hypothetical protein
MESWRDKTLQRSILVVGVGPLSSLYTFSGGPVLITHIILVRVQSVAHAIRADLGGLLSTLHSFSAVPVLITHIILIHVQRLTHNFRTALVALLFIFRLIVLLGLIATLSVFGVLHCELQEYRMQPLRK